MVKEAEKVQKERIPDDFQTILKFIVEDGSVLEGISDISTDVVVSVFGISIISDYQKTFESIRQVLNNSNPSAIFGFAVWTTTNQQKIIQDEGFGGPNFHELIENSLQELTSLSSRNGSGDNQEELPCKRWLTPNRAREMVVEDAGFDATSFQVHRSLHSVVWPNAQALWNMIASNPMSKLHQAPPEKIELGKQRLFEAPDRF